MDSKFKDVITVKAGESFTIDADIAGKPLPDIMWLKDGKEIDSATPRMEIKSTITQTVLTVKDCIRVDGGHFLLSLSNVGGTKQVPISVKVLDRPGPPDGPLNVTGVTAEKCYLHWSHPSHDGGAGISHYIIEKRETSRLSWTVVEPKIQAISYKVTKLLPGNEYIFRVMAVNKYGIGEPLESEPVLAKNPFNKPGPPSTPEASAVTRDSIVLTWERPEDDGGSQIDGYVLEKRDKEGIRWTKCNKKRLNDLRFRATGLTEGHFYEFRVSAENAAGVGTPSEPSQYYKACDATYPPGPPNNPKITDHSSTTVSLAWSRPIYDGGALVSGYIVEAKEVSEDEWTVCTPPTGVQTTRFTVKTLKENAEYNFRICALNIEGAGEHVDVPGSVIAAEKLEAPEIELDADLRKCVTVRASATLRLFVTIRGRPEPEVKWTKADGTLPERAQIEVTGSYTVLVIDNVNRFDTGKYVVTLENNSGTKSSFINVKVLDSPSAPVNFEIKDVKRDSVQLQWEPPQIDGGARITHYIVEKRESKRLAFTTVTNSCVRNSFKVDDLQEGGLYHFRVLAVNELGVGLPAETIEAVKVSQAPLPPGKITVVDVTREEYSFRIAAVNDKGKSDPKPLGASVVARDITIEPIIDLLFNTYSVKAGDDLKIDVPFRGRPLPEVTWKKDGHSLKQTTRVNVLTSKTSSKIVIKDSTREDAGKYEIILTSSIGIKSAEISVIVLDKPGPPGAIKVEEITMTICWERPVSDGGSSISGYVIEKREKSGLRWVRVNKKPVYDLRVKASNLREGCEYEYRVFAENAAGLSAPSVPCPLIKAEDPLFLPSPPAKPKIIDSSKTSITLSWNKPLFDGGSPVTGYMVEYRKTNDDDWTLGVSNTKSTEFTVVGLTSGAEYVFVVRSLNKIGQSEPSPETDPQIAKDREDEPVFLISNEMRKTLIVKDGSSFTLRVPFKGKPVPHVMWNKPDVDLRVRAAIDTTDNCTSITIEQATRDDSGKYTVTLQNVSFVNIVVLDRPSPPVGPVEMCDVTEDSVSLKWLPPAYDGGSPITNYIVFKRETTTANWIEVSSFTVSGLTQNESYEFRVMAKNAVGSISNPSATVGPVTCVDTYGAPEIELPPEYLDVVKYKAGATVQLKIGIIAKPQPTIEWYKDGKELESGAQISISNATVSACISIREASRLNSGTYELKIKNSLGSAYAAVRVLVQGMLQSLLLNTSSTSCNHCFNVFIASA
uniref:Titin n=1 Tax=Sinocyclocheilus rhinocerous TaxID=307959 RepID=A0A673JCM6_9TELE